MNTIGRFIKQKLNPEPQTYPFLTSLLKQTITRATLYIEGNKSIKQKNLFLFLLILAERRAFSSVDVEH
jgi:hypothetical protein